MFVVVILMLCILFVLSLPGVLISREKTIEKEIEKWIEIDIPSEFKIISCGNCGGFLSSVRYAYQIQFEETAFKLFMENWNKKYGIRRNWYGNERKIKLEIHVDEGNRIIFFDHGTLSRP